MPEATKLTPMLMTQPVTPGTRRVPASAMRFSVPIPPLGQAQADPSGKVPVSMVARSGRPIDHWFWGRIVHDMAGVQRSKDVLPIDFAHDDGDPDMAIGYLDTFDTSTGDLVAKGAIVPDPQDPQDAASKLLRKAQGGIPYEASINWGGSGIECEFLDEGESAMVNGYQFDGPGVIVRKWPLRGVAMCLYGADQNTSTNFRGDGDVSVTFSRGTAAKDHAMSQTDRPAVEGNGQPNSTPPAAQSQAVTFTSKDFIDNFGDKGARWFLEGKSFAQATAEHLAASKAEFAAEMEKLKAENADLKTKLAAAPRGNDAASFQAEPANPGQGAAPRKRQFGLYRDGSKFGDGGGLDRFVAGMKIPKAAASA